MGTFQPYRINQARLVAEAGLSGELELSGRLWDGRSVPLFRTHLAAESRAEELAFYLDEDIRAIECRTGDRSVVVDLAALEGRHGAVPPEEAALRARMRDLDPPVDLAPRGEAKDRLSLAGTDLVMAGFQASTTLFGFAVPRTSLWLLAGFAVLALAVSVLPMRHRRLRFVLMVGASSLGTLAVLGATTPRPTLFSVVFQGDGPGARVAGSLERHLEERSTYTLMAWTGGHDGGSRAARSGQVELLGLWAPVAPGIPLADIVPPGSLVRFSSPPLVSIREGEAFLTSRTFITGWVVHGL